MKQFLYTVTTAVLLCAGSSSRAQQFINRSFEPKGKFLSCADASSGDFNDSMGNIWASGGPGRVFIADASCGVGSPAHGRYFVGAEYENMTGGITIALKLDAYMTVGKKYRFTFDFMADPSKDAAVIYTGYNTTSDSMGHDSMVHIYTFPPKGSWQTITDSLVPGAPSRYIFLRAGTFGSGPLVTYLDNFRMLDVPTAGIAEEDYTNAVQVSPNPFYNKLSIRLDNPVTLPCTVSVMDLNGRVVRQATATDRQWNMDRGELPDGLYFLHITDRSGKTIHLKLLAQ